MSALLLLHSYMQTWVALCVCSNQPILFSMCTCISTCIDIHLTPHVSYTPWNGGLTSDKRCHLQSEVKPPIGGGTSNWRWGLHSKKTHQLQLELHGSLGAHVWHCVCPSHPAGGPKPWLKCLHASVHVYIATWLTMCASPHLNSYMETWMFLCGNVYVSQSPCMWAMPWLKCVHASVYVYMFTWLPMWAPCP